MTHCVESPFKQRGGIILVAPPGQMKSSMIEKALQGYGDARVMSDINVKTLMELRQSIVAKKITTMAFTALEKLYARNTHTSSNVEASLMAMVEEGFTKASFESQDGPPTRPARCLVIGGTFDSAVQLHWSRWKQSGFVRRMLWAHYSLENPEEILRAIHFWEPLKFGKIQRAFPADELIPYQLSDLESSFIMDIMKHQNEATPIVLMKKLYCVLKWKYTAEKAQAIIEDFAPALSKDGASISLPKAQRSNAQRYISPVVSPSELVKEIGEPRAAGS
jgi:hypothetical protein